MTLISPEIDAKMQVAAVARSMAMNQVYGSFEGYAKQVERHYQFYRHCEVMGSVWDRIASCELKRVMIFMPVRHGKSESSSRLLPGYYMTRNPRHHIGLASYAAELAHSLSRDARANYEETGERVSDDAAGVVEWHNRHGGRFWSAGVGGPITGKGFHLGIIDDPIKNQEEAYSQVIRDKVWEWWTHVWYTRMEPGAALVLVMTRWHPDDLAGRLLEQERTVPEHWHIVNFPVLKERVDQVFPETCTVEPDWRVEGEALCPERYNEADLARMRPGVGKTAWLALFQQRPTEDSGNIWKREWFEKHCFDERDLVGVSLTNRGWDWDTAYTEDEENSATAYFETALGSDGRIYVLDFDFDWLEFPDAVKWIRAKTGPHYIEQKASGKSIAQTLRKSLIYAMEVPVKGGDKVARAKIVSPLVESGRVRVHRRLLDTLLDDQKQGILRFKNSDDPGTDVNDAFVQALNRHRPFIVEDDKPSEKTWWGGVVLNEEDYTPEVQDWRDVLR